MNKNFLFKSKRETHREGKRQLIKKQIQLEIELK